MQSRVSLSRWAYLFPALGFLVFILFFAWMSFRSEVRGFVQDVQLRPQAIENLTKGFEKKLQQGFYDRFGFINLGGFAASSIELKEFNNIQKLQNGLLSGSPTKKFDPRDQVQKVRGLRDFLKARNIPLLVIAIPDKRSIYDTPLSKGYSNNMRETYLKFVQGLEEQGIDTIDMDRIFKESGLGSTDVFFKTDHHWNLQAGQLAAKKTMQFLASKGLAKYESTWLEDKSYTKQKLPRFFLGSQGKRTGKYYGGLDDIWIYQPTFPTSYEHSALSAKTGKWQYANTILRDDVIQETDFFEKDPHAAYVFGEFPLQRVINKKAINQLKVLLLGTSYRRVWQYFINSQFEEMDHFDPLRSKGLNGTVAQFIGETRPDIVIMVMSAGSIANNGIFNFGIENYLSALSATNSDEPIWTGDFDLSSPGFYRNKFESVAFFLQPGRTYTLTVDRTELLGSGDHYIQCSLHNLSTNRPVINRYFNANSQSQQKWIFQVPENTTDAFAIYIYAGTEGNTQGATMRLHGIAVREGVHESNETHNSPLL